MKRIAVFLNLICLVFVGAISAQMLKKLMVGESFEKELSGGEAHQYKIQAGGDFYLRLSVEQKGIDVVVTLLDPTNKKVFEINSPTAAQGVELISFITPSAGEYTLEIKSSDKSAPKDFYKINFEELTAATEKHRNRAKADKLFSEAEQYKFNPTAENLQNSLLKYDEAAKLYESAEDFRGAGNALNAAGEAMYYLAMYEKSRENFKKAAVLFKKAGARGEEALANSNVGAIYSAFGDYQKASEFYLPALDVFVELKDRQNEAVTRSNLADAYRQLGRIREAFVFIQRAEELCQGVCDKRNLAAVANNFGSVHDALGNYQKAIEYYLKSLPVFREIKDRVSESRNLSNIGAAYLNLGETQTAIEYFLQSLPIFKETGDILSETQTLSNLAVGYQHLGNYADAEKRYAEALKIFREVKDLNGEANVLSNLGVLSYTTDNFQKALEYYSQSLVIAKETTNKSGEGRLFYYLGQIYIALNNLPKAKENLLQAVAISSEIGDSDTQARSIFEMSVLEQKNGNLSQSLRHIEEAVKIIEENRAQMSNTDFRVSYFAQFQGFYQQFIGVLMENHRQTPNGNFAAKAFEISERSRSRGLIDLLSESRIDIRQGVDAKLLEKEKSLKGQISATAEKLFRKGANAQEKSALEKDLRDSKLELQKVSGEIKTKSPQYAALSQPTLLSVSDVQKYLDENTILLELSLGEKQSYAWAIGKNTIETFALPSRFEIESKAKKVYELLTARQPLANETPLENGARVKKADAEYPQAANDLSRVLLGEIYPKLKDKRLLIVADGALQYIPFAALPAPSDKNLTPLVVGHEIVNLPSASLLAALPKAAQNQMDVLTFADAVFDEKDVRLKNTATTKNLPSVLTTRGILRRLVFSKDEADSINLLAPAGNPKPVLGFDANLSRILSEDFSKYRYVHFATHGILDAQNPELSGIVLSLYEQNGKPRNGFLGLSDVYNLKMPVEMVVLSACQTALGKDVRGEGFIGLTRGFMYAGARRVVASLWSVNDNSTAQLMRRMYSKILKDGATPAAALRQAQIEMWKKPQNNQPFYWAAFTIQGDFR